MIRKCIVCKEDFKAYGNTRICSTECQTKRQHQRDIACEQRHPEAYLLYKARENARLGNHDFNLTIEDIIIPKYCPYLGVELVTKKGHKYCASIDRIDSSKGYIKGNIQIISYLANTMKSNATKEELLAFASGIFEIYK
jgi:hypothetical protein